MKFVFITEAQESCQSGNKWSTALKMKNSARFFLPLFYFRSTKWYCNRGQFSQSWALQSKYRSLSKKVSDRHKCRVKDRQHNEESGGSGRGKGKGNLRVGRCWRPQTEIKTQNALQELTLCRVVLHPEFCSFLVNTKTHFCSSCSSLGQQTPPEASRFLNSYILYLYHCCASSLHLNDAKNTFVYFVGVIVWSHLTGTAFSLTCFSKIAQKRFFFWYFLWKQPFTLESAHVLKVRNLKKKPFFLSCILLVQFHRHGCFLLKNSIFTKWCNKNKSAAQGSFSVFILLPLSENVNDSAEYSIEYRVQSTE